MRYPLFLDLTGQPVTIIGAGKVATRKIRSLLKAGALVTVISPTITVAIRRMKNVRWIRRSYRPGDLRGARLVVAATNDLDVNRRVCAEAKRRRLLVNCAAPPEAGNFIVPSVVRRAGVTIAISTGGAAPSRAKALRKQLEKALR
ncbi:MAG: bifunctional precorrin-2 dehydrogenase/sirohydrochlorin ferrochelatase [Verrucomicrobia bacterium]|nr:bifunctional precorrin-2 dehydrogenase/sirohydrochlorin ferrochelatase [Verrucomicrobiota bacterium]